MGGGVPQVKRMSEKEWSHPERNRGYPRPQLVRAEWVNLNGRWDFAIDHAAVWTSPDQVRWDRTINVPFAPETLASGIHDQSFYEAVWYRRTFKAPSLRPGERLLIHFGAVDYSAIVYLNDCCVGRHEGGYTPFTCDVTDALCDRAEQTLIVRAHDDPHDLAKPRGKQDWELKPHSIWYPRTTGIWQTVWMERVPDTYITRLRWTPNVEDWAISFEAFLDGERNRRMTIHVRLHVGDMIIADDSYLVVAGEVHRTIKLSDPGIDDSRNRLLWNPSTPTLIDAEIELRDEDGRVIDSVCSYTALRSIGVQGDRFLLNGRPYYLRMVLDQGYWDDTGLSAPSDAAIRRDIELIKCMGFNGARRHQQVSDPRWLYWADHLGLVVWAEMPSAYRFTRQSIQRLTHEWNAVIERDMSHPCIVAWVPLNESWGVPNLPDSPAQRHYVQALYHMTRTLDPSRPVVGNDGWEAVATDIIGIHDYDHQLSRLIARYGSDENLTRLFKRERPGGRLLLLSDTPTEHPIMLTEFGGIALRRGGEEGWGYTQAEDTRDFARRYTDLLQVVRELPALAGFCYTQFADTYQEVNGLLYSDRTPKFPIDEIAEATGGPQALHDRQVELQWRERMMSLQRYRYLVPEENHAVHTGP